MLVSFACQHAWLFFPGGVRFLGLLNHTGRFVPGSPPDIRFERREQTIKEWKRARQDMGRGNGGEALWLPLCLLWLWMTTVGQHLWVCRVLSLPLSLKHSLHDRKWCCVGVTQFPPLLLHIAVIRRLICVASGCYGIPTEPILFIFLPRWDILWTNSTLTSACFLMFLSLIPNLDGALLCSSPCI